MHKYCLLLNQDFINDLSVACNKFLNNENNKYMLDSIKEKVKQELQKSSKILYVKKENNKKWNVKNLNYNEIFTTPIHKINILNADILGIKNDKIIIQIQIMKGSKSYDLYFLKFGINKCVLIENDSTYASIPVSSYILFKNNFKDQDFNINNSKTSFELNTEILFLLEQNKITFDDNTINKFDKNCLFPYIENKNIFYTYKVNRIGGEFVYDLTYLIDKKVEDKFHKDLFNNLLIGTLLD